jgi:hypothetical protein
MPLPRGKDSVLITGQTGGHVSNADPTTFSPSRLGGRDWCDRTRQAI